MAVYAVYSIAEGIVVGVVKHRHAILEGLGNAALVAIALPICAIYYAAKPPAIVWGKVKQ